MDFKIEKDIIKRNYQLKNSHKKKNNGDKITNFNYKEIFVPNTNKLPTKPLFFF